MFIAYRFIRPLLLSIALLLVVPGAQASLDFSGLRSGELLLSTGSDHYQAATRLQTHASIRITGPLARTTLSQQFRNDSDAWVQAIYAFPLPEDAAVDHLRMQIGARIIEGEIQPRAQARKTYASARKQGQRAALLEQQRPNLFTTAVANIPPHSEITVQIQYQQMLQWRNDAFSLRLPLAITPRYNPAAVSAETHHIQINKGWALLPGEIPNTASLDPKHPVQQPVSISIVLSAGFALAEVTSPSHTIIKQREADGLHIHLAAGTAPANKDFRLRWKAARGSTPQAAFFTEKTADGSYGLLMLMPPRQAASNRLYQPRDVIYVIDTSGSMGGESMRSARAALLTALTTLTPRDRFNVIEFDSDSHALFNQPRQADGTALPAARLFVNGLQADGGTEMLGALQMAFGQPQMQAGGRLRQIVFITDGAVSNEDELMQLIHASLGDCRLFMVGIGSAPNSYFMTEAAHFGRGSYTFIANSTEVKPKMEALFAQLTHPVLTDLKLKLPVAADVLPNPIPDLYLGDPLVMVAKLGGDIDTATLSGMLGQQPWTSRLSLQSSQPHSGIGVRWARQKIRFWHLAGNRGADASKVEQAITTLAMQHHLVSRYTSLVAVDKTPARPRGAALHKQVLERALPAGMTVPMAQTGTATTLYLLLGLLCALLGLGLRMRRGDA